MLSKNTYFLPQDSANSEVELNEVEVLLHRQYQEMFLGHHYLAANTPPFSAEAAANLISQDLGDHQNGDPAAFMANASQTQPTVKRDRHSKIFTAQGPRDRRVRLSIDIARKFFDLQETLGFDKPSKTLDWLLTKSRAAIKELVQTKQNGSRSSPGSECDEVLSFGGNEDASEKRNSSAANSRKKSANKYKGSKDHQQAASNHAKESRAKARARARERTREKMCIKQLNDLNRSIPIHYGDNLFKDFQQSSSNNISCIFDANSGFCGPIINRALSNEAVAINDDDLIHESTVIQRKAKNPWFLGLQQNLISSKELSTSSYSTRSDVNAAENLDICSFTSQSNLCAIWDQHKFIDRKLAMGRHRIVIADYLNARGMDDMATYISDNL